MPSIFVPPRSMPMRMRMRRYYRRRPARLKPSVSKAATMADMTTRLPRAGALVFAVSVAAIGCTTTTTSSPAMATPADAKAFLDTVNATMLKLGIAQGEAGWVQQTYITDDTE